MKVYVLFDERANVPGKHATVLAVARSVPEARRDKHRLFPTAVIFEYDEVEGTFINGKKLEQ